MEETFKLPVLPLRETVLFPGVTVPITAGRKSTLAAVQSALAGDSLVFAVAQRSNVEKVTPDLLYTVGTVARITQVERGQNSTQLLLHGERRGIAVRMDDGDGFLVATLRDAAEISPANPSDSLYVALDREVRERAAELGKKAGIPDGLIRHALNSVASEGRLADLVASYVEAPTASKQELLEMLPIDERLRRLLVLVQRQIEVLDAQQDIKSRVQQELGDRQRELVLREQLKAIRKELHEDDGENDLEELRLKLDKLELPPDVRKEVEREYGRLAGMNREAMEAQVLRTYLETIVELPWNKSSAQQLDLERAERILDEDHFGLDDVKDRVLEFLAVLQLRDQQTRAAVVEPVSAAAASSESEASDVPKSDATVKEVAPDSASAPAPIKKPERSKAPILLFTGPPGVGKTSIAKSIARALGREYVRISLGGARDEADIRGHRRTYVGAMPGRIIQGMRQAGTKNPVFLLDEVDKLGVSFQGDPSSALLEVLDPAQNDSFVDHYLGVPFDLSEVLFVATANLPQHIPAPLLDRMEAVEFSGYTEAEKLEIAKRYLVPRQLEGSALSPTQLELTDAALKKAITFYTREAGVRQLELVLSKLARKVARRVAARTVERVEVGADDLVEFLGRPKVHPEEASHEDDVGVATGMFYTPAGGDILFVEVTTMRGTGKLILTGQLGDVMKESARAMLSYARSHAAALGIDEAHFERDVHIHVPAGAIPKDGPSAGVTLGTALVSALSGAPVRHDLAMTGEVTLTGRVLPIGGVKEKVLGAVRAGITRIVLPKENEGDLDDLPAEVRRNLEVFPVQRLDEVLRLALVGGIRRRQEAVGVAG
ncbi:MAG: endopeptidase La [Planctomycetota bacterium]